MQRTDEYARFDRNRALRWLLMPAARGLSVYFRARVFGEDHIPRDAPVVYVGKHPRTFLYLETLLLGLKVFWDNDRPPIRVLEMRESTIHRTPLLGWMRRNVNAIPAGEEHALEALRQGESVLIFPGGTRELRGAPDELRWQGRTGFARVAIEAQVPIIPFAIVGADQQHLGRIALGRSSVWLPPFPLPVRLDYHFGHPIPPPPRRSDQPLSGPPGCAEPWGEVVDRHAARALRAAQALLADGRHAR
jgi:1-acyl-sn-glycerol-3-phosphate acyltransferase